MLFPKGTCLIKVQMSQKLFGTLRSNKGSKHKKKKKIWVSFLSFSLEIGHQEDLSVTSGR